MSVLVALETATDTGSVALAANGQLLGEVTIGTRTRHAESLLPALEFLLRQSGRARGEIGGIVVGAGPGSFTGVRIAAATARGLARGLDVPLLAFSTLAALAVDSPHDLLCPVLDARRGEVYAACYTRGGAPDTLVTLVEPQALPVAELLGVLPAPRPLFIGDGARRYADELGILPPPPAAPRASALLRLAAADPEAGRVPADWEPLYLRGSGAERGAAGRG